MSNDDFADLGATPVRKNSAVPRLDVRPLRGPLFLIAGALLLLALLLLPVSILAVEAIFAKAALVQAIQDYKEYKTIYPQK
jgi:hypothetical protein